MPLISPPSSMASSIPHHFYSNYTFTTNSDIVDLPTQVLSSSHDNNNNNNNFMDNNNNFNSMMWGCQDSLMPVFDNGGFDDQIVSLDCDTMLSSSAAGWININPNFGDQHDFAVPALLSDCKMGFYGGGNAINGGFQNFHSRYNQPHIAHEFGDECCGFVEDVKPASAYPNAARENWGIQGNQIAAVEEPNIKVGRYSEEERKERILRYLKKRNQRNFNKTIKYACRKTLADRRVRVRGRFARNNEICEEDHMATKKLENHHDHSEDFYGSDSFQFQLKNEEEDWLQEAMASLVYLSHSSPEDM